MAVSSEIANRVRLELGDLPATFSESFVGDGASTVFNLAHYPLDLTTVVVRVNGTAVAASAEARTGRVVMGTAPAAGAVITVSGTHYRYFSPEDMSTFIDSAVETHINKRTDKFGRPITLATLPSVEVYPLSLMATVQCLWALATDASFDIDINTPDGVSVPRSERFRQLMDMIQSREAQYKELSAALGVGLYSIETFTFRRISKATGRYIPVFQPQEIDDLSRPTRIFLSMPSYGSDPLASSLATYDLTMVRGDAFSVTVDFDFDVSNYTVEAQIRTVPESPVVAAEFTIVKTDAPAGTVSLSLTPAQTRRMPPRAYWDLQVTNDSNPDDVRTLVGGIVASRAQVTR